MCFGQQIVSSEPSPDQNPSAVLEQNTAARLASQRAGVRLIDPGSGVNLTAGTGAGLAQKQVGGAGGALPRGGAGVNLGAM